jgi:hypothetical protein
MSGIRGIGEEAETCGLTDKEWELCRPWNIWELDGARILTQFEYLFLVFNPKIDAVTDLWFLHQSIQLEKVLLT